MRGGCRRGGWKEEAIDIGIEGPWGLCAKAENPSCETPSRLTTHIAAPSPSRSWRKTADVVKARSRVTGQPQIANRPLPPVRGPVAAKRCEADDAMVGTPPADAKLRRCAKGGRLRPDPDVPLTEYPLELRSSSHMRSEPITAVAHDVLWLDNCAEKCGARQTDQAPVRQRQGRSLSRPNRYRPVHPDHNGAHYRVYVEVVTVVVAPRPAVSRQLQEANVRSVICAAPSGKISIADEILLPGA